MTTSFSAIFSDVFCFPFRKEMITFSKLKGAVQELTRRSFEEKHLGQIMTIYPESYELTRVWQKAMIQLAFAALVNFEISKNSDFQFDLRKRPSTCTA